MRSSGEDPVLRSARREATLTLVFWLLVTCYCVGYCYWHGYAHSPEDLAQKAAELTFVLGVPSWVFWGLLVPWLGCLAFSTWFAFGFMADDPLGDEDDESSGVDNVA